MHFSFKQNYQIVNMSNLPFYKLVFDLQHHILLYTDITPICSRLYIIIRHWKLIYESLRYYNSQTCTTWFVIGPMITKLTFSAYIFILFLFSCLSADVIIPHLKLPFYRKGNFQQLKKKSSCYQTYLL